MEAWNFLSTNISPKPASLFLTQAWQFGLGIPTSFHGSNFKATQQVSMNNIYMTANYKPTQTTSKERVDTWPNV